MALAGFGNKTCLPPQPRFNEPELEENSVTSGIKKSLQRKKPGAMSPTKTLNYTFSLKNFPKPICENLTSDASGGTPIKDTQHLITDKSRIPELVEIIKRHSSPVKQEVSSTIMKTHD